MNRDFVTPIMIAGGVYASSKLIVHLLTPPAPVTKKSTTEIEQTIDLLREKIAINLVGVKNLFGKKTSCIIRLFCNHLWIPVFVISLSNKPAKGAVGVTYGIACILLGAKKRPEETIPAIETNISLAIAADYRKNSDRYHSPDRNKVLPFVTEHLAKGRYKGFGLIRKETKVNPATGNLHLCDILYMEKYPWQVHYEKGETSLFWDILTDMEQAVSSAQESQQNVVNSIKPLLETFALSLGYESVYFCNQKGLFAFGYPAEVCFKADAIFFFYKKN